MRAPLALAAFTGMRRGELLGLRWVDVDLEGRRVYLRETKNGSLRVLALNALAINVPASLPEGAPGDLVLPGVDAQKLSVYTRRLFAGVGIADASFHSLRHTAASWLLMQGVDLYAVGQLLGHRTPRMTQRYAHLSPQYMAGAVGKLDSVFGEVMPVPRTPGSWKRLKVSCGHLAGCGCARLNPALLWFPRYTSKWNAFGSQGTGVDFPSTPVPTTSRLHRVAQERSCLGHLGVPLL